MRVGAYGMNATDLWRQRIESLSQDLRGEQKTEIKPSSVDEIANPTQADKVDETQKTQGTFFDILNRAVENEQKAEQAVDNYVRGDAPLHETMITLTKSDISLRLMVNVRNKLLDAYREVMRMS